jgi:hypothetical protein
MADANESPGLKIAVAAFISISVILAVALYFVYTAYTQADARLQDMRRTNEQLTKAQRVLLNQYEDLKAQMNRPSDAVKQVKDR